MEGIGLKLILELEGAYLEERVFELSFQCMNRGFLQPVLVSCGCTGRSLNILILPLQYGGHLVDGGLVQQVRLAHSPHPQNMSLRLRSHRVRILRQFQQSRASSSV